ncbi:hypothetical protein BDV26DRAFT_258397 [Aspergillus bertholletiae]|uniref:Uncharacterized protein n=1 Tax=Aspergillus bertholletiae TaxID=1226010 RepID=A0A5N7BDT2_9EURO|nr:hypothetical protein BDV26DRAFT_258397 [Aspergillus bertholletiae]
MLQFITEVRRHFRWVPSGLQWMWWCGWYYTLLPGSNSVLWRVFCRRLLLSPLM